MQNSVLFDFYSLIDREISTIKFLAGEYRETALQNFDKHRVLYTSDLDWKLARTQNKDDVFKSLMIGDEFKQHSESVLNALWADYEMCILGKYAFKTNATTLISAYSKIGRGDIVKIAVYCENETQKKFVTQEFPSVAIETGERKDVDLTKYNRVIVGNYKHALMYDYPGPKSIVVLNFSENYSEDDFTLLSPELVINLGDIHDIEIMSAYITDQDEN